VHKAHYVLMNIECDQDTVNELEHSFKFSDAVLRHLIIKMPKAWTAPSPMMKEEKSKSMMERGAEAKPAEAKPAEAPAA
jgi:small subunit ribosomal protein S6